MDHQEIRLHAIPKDLNEKLTKICEHFGKHRTQVMRPMLREFVENNRHVLDDNPKCKKTTEYRIPLVNNDIANDFIKIADHQNKSKSDLIIPAIEKFVDEYRSIWDYPTSAPI